MTSEWGEKHDVSWIDWKIWNVSDQAFQLPWLIADAQAKNHAWWNIPPASIFFRAASPTAPKGIFSQTATNIQVNGRLVNSSIHQGEKTLRLLILPKIHGSSNGR